METFTEHPTHLYKRQPHNCTRALTHALAGEHAAAWHKQRQLEAYRRYVELAKFRSEKRRFPGPNRGYAEADKRLMWHYIEDTAPLCGKLPDCKNRKESYCRNMAHGTAADIIKCIYDRSGVIPGETKRVLMQVYAVLKALREEAFKHDGRMYVVNDVGAWIAFSNIVDMLVIGDGYITPVELRVVAKATPRETLQGETTLMRELAKALGAAADGGGKIHLRNGTCACYTQSRPRLPSTKPASYMRH